MKRSNLRTVGVQTDGRLVLAAAAPLPSSTSSLSSWHGKLSGLHSISPDDLSYSVYTAPGFRPTDDVSQSLDSTSIQSLHHYPGKAAYSLSKKDSFTRSKVVEGSHGRHRKISNTNRRKDTNSSSSLTSSTDLESANLEARAAPSKSFRRRNIRSQRFIVDNSGHESKSMPDENRFSIYGQGFNPLPPLTSSVLVDHCKKIPPLMDVSENGKSLVDNAPSPQSSISMSPRLDS